MTTPTVIVPDKWFWELDPAVRSTVQNYVTDQGPSLPDVLTSRQEALTLLDGEELRSDADLVLAPAPASGLARVTGGLHVNTVLDTFRIPRMTTAQQDAIPDPERGEMLYNEDFSAYMAYFETAGPGTGFWSPLAEFPNQAFGLDQTDRVTVLTTNVPAEIVGTQVASGDELAWTLDTTGGVSKWTYTGPDRILPIELKYQASAEKFQSGTAISLLWGIRVNNIDVGLQAQTLGRQNEPVSVNCAARVPLETSDVVTFFVENLTVGDEDAEVLQQAFSAKGY